MLGISVSPDPSDCRAVWLTPLMPSVTWLEVIASQETEAWKGEGSGEGSPEIIRSQDFTLNLSPGSFMNLQGQ